MFEIKLNEKNEFIVEGQFNLGIIGQFESSMVLFEFDVEEYRKHIDDYKAYEGYLKPDMTLEEIAQGLTRYYENKQREINNNIEKINELLLIHLFTDMNDTGFEFWIEEGKDYPDFIISEKMPKCSKEEMSERIYTAEFEEMGNIFWNDEDEIIDCGCITFREFINKTLPMIDLDKLIESIFPTVIYIGLPNGKISFQCSSEACDYGIVCEAYAEIGDDFRLYDWTNF